MLRRDVHSAEEMEEFLKHARIRNVAVPTVDIIESIFWEDICTVYGFRLQQNKNDLKHRMLDPKGVRRAVWDSSVEFFTDLKRFREYSDKKHNYH